MPRTLTAHGTIAGGRLTLTARDKFEHALRGWKDGEVEITLKRVEPKRSDPANRYYWGQVVPIARDTINEEWGADYGKLKIHEILKEHCNQVDHETSSGRIIRIARDTHDMPHSEFCDYIERCRRMLAEYFGVYVPDPEKVDKPEPTA